MAIIPYISTNDFVKQQAEKYISQTKWTVGFPDQLIYQCFSFLNLEGLSRVSSVVKNWKDIASDETLYKEYNIKTLFTKALNESAWKLYANDLIPPGPLPVVSSSKALIKKLKRLTTLQLENGAGTTFLTIPKGLTLNKIVQFFNSERNVRISIPPSILEGHGDTAIDETYHVAITNNILLGSKNDDINKNELLGLFEMQAPKIIEVVSLIALTYLNSPVSERNRTILFRFGCSTKCEEGRTIAGDSAMRNDGALGLTATTTTAAEIVGKKYGIAACIRV